MSELREELKLEFQSYNQEKLNKAFIHACENGHLESVRYLLTSSELKKHADIHAYDDRGFRWACENGYLDIVRYLLTSYELIEHANIHANHDGGFHWACIYGHLDIVCYLLTFSGEYYIDFQQRGYDLDWAISEKHHNVVKAMITSLYKNDIMAYLENISKIEKYCQEHRINFLEWQEEMVKEDGDINFHTTELFL